MKMKGIVVATNPSDHSVDLVLSDGRRMSGVQVSTPNGSTRSGTFDMPAVPTKADKWDITKLTGQDQIAIVDWVGNVPIVTGFLFPQDSQMTFADPKLKVTRHQSDVTTSIDGDGNIQLSHPSGTYIRIGESPEAVDLSNKNEDKSLAVDRNTGRRVNVRIGLAGGVLELTLSPTGAVTLKCAQDFTLETQGAVNVTAAGAATVKAASVKLDAADTHVTGNLKVDGATTLAAVTSNGVNVGNDHRHANSGGSGTGGPPV